MVWCIIFPRIDYGSLHSLGLFYSSMTSFLGFRPNEGEYKVMGLASYGNPDTFYEKVKLSDLEEAERNAVVRVLHLTYACLLKGLELIGIEVPEFI